MAHRRHRQAAPARKTLPGYYATWNEYAANGRRTYHSKHFTTASVARAWVKQFNAKMDLGAIAEIAPVPFPTATEEFLAGCSTLSHGTTVQYSGALGMFRVIVEDKDVHEIDGADIDRFINWRLKASSEATVAKHVRALRRFFRWCMKRGMTHRIPLDQAAALPSDRSVRPKPVLAEKDLDRLISKLDTDDRKPAVQLAVTTGLDRGEAGFEFNDALILDRPAFLRPRDLRSPEINLRPGQQQQREDNQPPF